ncbi:MAG: RidA family protein [Phycisphaerales bacterium]
MPDASENQPDTTPTDTPIHARLAALGLSLPTPTTPLASYVPVVVSQKAGIAFVSGQIPVRDGTFIAIGRVPSQVSIETAQECARQCVLNALAALERELGSLDRIARILKVEGFVACEPGFTHHPEVINGASDLLLGLFGETGRHARAAVGVPSLPRDVPVEIAFTVELK